MNAIKVLVRTCANGSNCYSGGVLDWLQYVLGVGREGRGSPDA